MAKSKQAAKAKRKTKSKSKEGTPQPGSIEEVSLLLHHQIALQKVLGDSDLAKNSVKETDTKLRKSIHSWTEKAFALKEYKHQSGALSNEQELSLRRLTTMLEEVLKSKKGSAIEPLKDGKAMDLAMQEMERLFIEPEEDFATKREQWKPQRYTVIDDRDESECRAVCVLAKLFN